MIPIICHRCGSPNLVKRGSTWVCENCETRYVEDADRQPTTGEAARAVHSERIDKLYRIARRAKDDGDVETAAKYYDLLLQEEPDSWEIAFYSVYYSASLMNQGSTAGAVNRVGNGLSTVLDLVRSGGMGPEQQKAAMNEIRCKLVEMFERIRDSEYRHFDAVNAYSGTALEYLDFILAAKDLFYGWGDLLAANAGADPFACMQAAKSWRYGVSVVRGFFSQMTTIAAHLNRPQILVQKRRLKAESARYRDKAKRFTAAGRAAEEQAAGQRPKKAGKTKRKGMVIAAFILFAVAVCYGLLAWTEPVILSAGVLCAGIGGMLLVLSASPKNKPCLFGKNTGMKRGWFVAVCIAATIALTLVTAYCLKDETGVASAVIAQDTDAALADPPAEAAAVASIYEVQAWYAAQQPMVNSR